MCRVVYFLLFRLPHCVKPEQPTAWRFLGTARPAGGMEEMTRFQKGKRNETRGGGTGHKKVKKEEDSRPLLLALGG